MIVSLRRSVISILFLFLSTSSPFSFLSKDICHVSAFAARPSPIFVAKSHSHQSPLAAVTNRGKKGVVLNNSENSDTSDSTSSSSTNNMETTRGGAAAAAVKPAAPAKKLRITAFDSMRFVLCVMIVFGHFISFANPSPFWLKFFSQHNTVPVSAFFLLSGYVAAYTSTENGQREPSAKLVNTPKPQWILSKVFGYYPLHLLVLLLFSPVFIYTDLKYNGPWTAAWHALLSGTLTQAWFPMSAEIWNAPTWYLSSLTFATAVMPYALTIMAKQDKKELRRTAGWLWLTTLLPKLAYCHDLNVWTMPEGVTSPKAHPNMALFNMQRFSPLYMVSEILLGAVACRLVMLDGADDKIKTPKTTALSTLTPLAAILAVMCARASGILQANDLLTRAVVIIPLVCRLFMGVHRSAVQGTKDPLTSLLSNKTLVWLGGLAFPIYIVHGPIGQIFYKKIIAKALWGQVLKGPEYFGLYLATTAVSAFLIQKLFLQNKRVGQASKDAVAKLSTWM
jgi:peptidoglycan/LPS O-acetylase OafA/YrhL